MGIGERLPTSLEAAGVTGLQPADTTEGIPPLIRSQLSSCQMFHKLCNVVSAKWNTPAGYIWPGAPVCPRHGRLRKLTDTLGKHEIWCPEGAAETTSRGLGQAGGVREAGG